MCDNINKAEANLVQKSKQNPTWTKGKIVSAKRALISRLITAIRVVLGARLTTENALNYIAF